LAAIVPRTEGEIRMTRQLTIVEGLSTYPNGETRTEFVVYDGDEKEPCAIGFDTYEHAEEYVRAKQAA
jgi:hypothetical protein